MQSGAIAGRIRVTVTGGSIVIDPATIILYNAIAVSPYGFIPQANISASPVTFTPVPVPAVSEWTFGVLAIAMVAVGILQMRADRASGEA
jgi:hypothetical protein